MKKILKTVLLFAFLFVLLTGVHAQSKTKSKTKNKEEEVVPPPPPPAPPPPGIEMREADSAEIAAAKARDRAMADAGPGFDTTAAPDDIFTKNILRLITATNAINLGLSLVDNMPKADEENESVKEITKRLMQEMKEGAGRRWTERIYVREYRKRFTNEEVEAMIAFYESPVGKKLINQTSDMLPGLMNEGRKMAYYLVTEIYTQMLKEQKNH